MHFAFWTDGTEETSWGLPNTELVDRGEESELEEEMTDLYM